MLIGQDNLEEIFGNLIKSNQLSHSYIFFGEPQVGKYSFALSLASCLEKGIFEKVEVENELPKHVLEETLIVRPEGDSIGIDAIRDIKHFLSRKPVYSAHRVVIVDEAHTMTSQAQHATLKIAEEPPPHSLLILITLNIDSLLTTLQSRFQRVYFPRLRTEEIAKLLEDDYKIDRSKADPLAKLSLGRPGRAVSLATNEEEKERFKTASSILAKKTSKSDVIGELLENEDRINPLFAELIARLANDPIKNYDTLRSITLRMSAMSQFSVNKRLQIETALWNI